jgi:hypothetical protein
MEPENTKGSEPRESPTFSFTAAELQDAVECYELLDQSEVEKAYQVMLAVPQFGLKVAKALQFAAKMSSQGKMGPDRVLDAAVVPAFLIGLLVGFGRKLEHEKKA